MQTNVISLSESACASRQKESLNADAVAANLQPRFTKSSSPPHTTVPPPTCPRPGPPALARSPSASLPTQSGEAATSPEGASQPPQPVRRSRPEPRSQPEPDNPGPMPALDGGQAQSHCPAGRSSLAHSGQTVTPSPRPLGVVGAPLVSAYSSAPVRGRTRSRCEVPRPLCRSRGRGRCPCTVNGLSRWGRTVIQPNRQRSWSQSMVSGRDAQRSY